MHSIGAEDVGSALLITLVLVIVSITIVGLTMWWLYRVFKTPKDESHTNPTVDSKNSNS